MKLKVVTALVFSFVFCTAGNATKPPSPNVRQVQIFNSGWKFNLADEAIFREPDYDDSSWRPLELPHDWSIELEADEKTGGAHGYFPTGIGWYRKSFVLPESMHGKKVVVRFDGIYMNSEVWINGVFLGRYPYGYSTLHYDLTEFLKKGNNEVNVLAVRVDNSLQPSTRWYNGSGIYRNVWLISTGFIHFHNYKGVFVSTPEATGTEAKVRISYDAGLHYFPGNDHQAFKTRLFNPKRMEGELTFRSTITDLNGTVVGSTESSLLCEDLNPSYTFTHNCSVENPVLWSADNPVLYYLRSEIIYKDSVIDDQVTPFGIRKLEYIPHKGMFVNGRMQKLKGVCLHHDAGSFGAAVPVEVWRYRLLKLKAMGCNAIRTSHNPAAPEFYDLCDSLGFYVMNEAFDEWTRDWFYNFAENPRGKARYGYHLYFKQWAETDLKAMVWRDRNHPSVVMYSVGNEVPDQKENNPVAGQTIGRLIQWCHEADDTRPVTVGCNLENTAEDNGFIDAMDITGFNYIDRVHKDQMYLPEYEKRPEKLIVGTETPFSLRDFLAYRDHDFAIGQFIWTGIDYLGEAGAFPRRGFYASLIDIAGFEKPGYYYCKSMWSDEPVTYIAVRKRNTATTGQRNSPLMPDWNWQLGDSLDVTVYSNCEQVDLVLNNKSLGKKTVDRNLYYARWTVPYAPGNLAATGFNNRKKAVSHTLSTHDKTRQLSVKTHTAGIDQQTTSLVFAEINVTDGRGAPVWTANNEVTVNVKGDARLVALDSGDLNYTGLFKTNTRKAFNGNLLAVIEITGPGGKVDLEISSPGLKSITTPLFPAK
jgi:beta-galactosidase